MCFMRGDDRNCSHIERIDQSIRQDSTGSAGHCAAPWWQWFYLSHCCVGISGSAGGGVEDSGRAELDSRASGCVEGAQTVTCDLMGSCCDMKTVLSSQLCVDTK